MEKELETHPLVVGLGNRLGAHRVKVISNPLHPDQAFLLLFIEKNVPVTAVMTLGLSDYKMPVLDSWKGREHNEIYFCLPSFWELDDMSNPNFAWPFDWIYRLEKFVREKNTWFGPGHTIPTGNPAVQLSEQAKHDYLFFSGPLFLEEELAPLAIKNQTIYFLGIIPIFGEELDYKMGKGTQKFLKRFVAKGFDERIDEYRPSVMKSRMYFF